jgi:DNA polymerase-4
MPASRSATTPSSPTSPSSSAAARRGVVSTACYIARIKGVRSAMPMFKALKLCPEAVVVRGRMDVYAEVSRQVRAMMDELTPAIEPLSLDEAFLDLTGTARLHGAPPAVMLARLVKRMEAELGITGSIGLSHNKFLAKIASDLDKPRGFSVIGKAETPPSSPTSRSAHLGRRAPGSGRWPRPASAPSPTCCAGTGTT